MGIDVKQTARDIVAAVEQVWTGFRGLTFSISNIAAIFDFFVEVVKTIEEYANKAGGMTAKEKRDVAIHAINEVVDIPFVPEAFEDNLIGLVVDRVLAFLNHRFGHGWFAKLTAPTADPDVTTT